jgi:hypothetical protein
VAFFLRRATLCEEFRSVKGRDPISARVPALSVDPVIVSALLMLLHPRARKRER